MPASEAKRKPVAGGQDILDLAEAAAYLRVEESDLAELCARGEVPARKIGSAWRFHREALGVWLRGDRAVLPDYPTADAVLMLLEKRLLEALAAQQARPRPGTKEAVLKHYGISRDADDLEEQLAAMRRLREAGG